MKKLLCALLFCVFALSFVASVAEINAEPAPATVCRATCDYSVGLLWICCPVYKGQNNQLCGKEDCFYGAPCGPII